MHYTKEFLIRKIEKLEAALEYYNNPCLFCGPDSWSTYVCEDCANKDYDEENEDQLELDCE